MENRIIYLLVIVLLVFGACRQDKFADLYGTWRYDVPNMKRQALDELIKMDTVKADTVAVKLSLDTLFKPIEPVVMEYKRGGNLVAYINDTLTQKGVWRVSRDEKYFVTRIEGIEKIYEINSISKERLVFKETQPNTTIKEFILYPVK